MLHPVDVFILSSDRASQIASLTSLSLGLLRLELWTRAGRPCFAHLFTEAFPSAALKSLASRTALPSLRTARLMYKRHDTNATQSLNSLTQVEAQIKRSYGVFLCRHVVTASSRHFRHFQSLKM